MIFILIILVYLLNVGLVNYIQFLINLIFDTNFDYNVWLLGILLMIITSIFNNKK